MVKYLKLILSAAIFLHSNCFVAIAGDAEDLKAAYEKGNFKKIVEIYRKSDKLDTAAGLRALGRVHELGEGVKQDYKKAFEYYKAAVAKGDIYAENNLGLLYTSGKGVKRDLAKACGLFASSAGKNNASAQDNLGLCYARGDGGQEKDLDKAEALFKVSAFQGYAGGQHNYATLLFNTGREPKGYFWFKVMHARGDMRSEQIIQHVDKQLKPDELKAIEEAVKLCISSHYKSCNDEIMLKK